VDVVEAGDVGEEEEGEAEEADARIYVYIGVLSPSGQNHKYACMVFRTIFKR